MHLKGADGMANSVDPDQTASLVSRIYSRQNIRKISCERAVHIFMFDELKENPAIFELPQGKT